MNFQKYFNTLKDWKRLPAYNLESRIDSFIGFFLPDILKESLNIEVKGIIPGFPLRVGTIHPEYSGKPVAERSYKVDFYVPGEDGVHYFIEVKTAIGSLRDPQDDYLDKATERGMEKIIDGLTRLAKMATFSHKEKYDHLLRKLKEYGILNEIQSFISPEDTIQVIYIRPRLPRKDKGERVIDFKTVARILEEKYPEDEFVMEFAKSLEAWSMD
jgi:hypothetical protein